MMKGNYNVPVKDLNRRSAANRNRNCNRGRKSFDCRLRLAGFKECTEQRE